MNELEIINKKIDQLINDTTEYGFKPLKQKVEEILKSVEIFMIDKELDKKAVDLYLKNVITQRNNIKKEQEKSKIDDSKQTKYSLIESICKKLEFETQEMLIKKVEELEKKTNLELNQINNSL